MATTYIKNGLKTDTLTVTGSASIPAISTATSLTVGASGTAITQMRVYSQTITPASVAAATSAEQTFTVTGLTTADKVIVNAGAITNSVAVGNARVSATNTLAVQFCNPTAGALTPTAVTWTIIAIRS